MNSDARPVNSLGDVRKGQAMKRSSWFSTAFLAFCLLLGSIIDTGPARLAAQIPRFSSSNAKTFKEIADVKQRIAKNPNDVREHYRLGGLYEKLFLWKNAVAAYSQVVRIKPDLANAHYDMGWCYTRLDNYEAALKAHQEAEKHIRIASSKLPEKKVKYAIGWNLYKLRRYDEAVEQYLKAVQLAPSYQVAIYEIGRVYLAQGDQERAMQVADKLEPELRDLLLKEIKIVEWVENGGATGNSNPVVFKMDPETQPNILFMEKPKYNLFALDHNIQGIVVFGVVFNANGKITGVRIIRDLPYGLTAQALIALRKMKFTPAMKDGQPVSVRGKLEFSFNLD
jgi:tetratricopeptide (TPR) repeat protein